MLRRHQAVSLEQALQQAPTLARLTALVRESGARLAAIAPLIPPPLRASVKAGPIDGTQWCLLVSSSAASAKLRQLLPQFVEQLRSQGWDVSSIRLKVQAA